MSSVMEEFVSKITPVDYSYNPSVDLQEVDQFGFLNLAEAYSRGIIPGDSIAMDDAFNGVDEPGVLIPRAQDQFDALRKAEYVRESLNKLNAAEKEAVQNAVERTVSVTPEGA